MSCRLCHQEKCIHTFRDEYPDAAELLNSLLALNKTVSGLNERVKVLESLLKDKGLK